MNWYLQVMFSFLLLPVVALAAFEDEEGVRILPQFVVSSGPDETQRAELSEDDYIYWETTEVAKLGAFFIGLTNPDGDEVAFMHMQKLYEDGLLQSDQAYQFSVFTTFADKSYRRDRIEKIVNTDGKVLFDVTRCEVHDAELKMIKGLVVYGLPHWPYAMEEQKQFPNYYTGVLGGCFTGRQKYGIKKYCHRCVVAERSYRNRIKHPRLN